MQIFHVAEATLNAKSDRRTPKTVVKCKFSVCSVPGGPSVHRKCAHSAHVHENGFSRPPGDFTYTPPFSRPYRGFHVFSRTFMVFSRPFAHIFTYVLWFSRPSPVFTPTPCFHVHTVIFEFIWPNGLWTHFSCPNGPPG